MKKKKTNNEEEEEVETIDCHRLLCVCSALVSLHRSLPVRVFILIETPSGPAKSPLNLSSLSLSLSLSRSLFVRMHHQRSSSQSSFLPTIKVKKQIKRF
jgi:hypothetical protein